MQGSQLRQVTSQLTGDRRRTYAKSSRSARLNRKRAAFLICRTAARSLHGQARVGRAIAHKKLCCHFRALSDSEQRDDGNKST